jgi:hypothetical protein
MRRVLAATAAELLELQPLCRRFPILGGRIISLFAIAALQRDNLSGHKTAPKLLTEKKSVTTSFRACLFVFEFCLSRSRRARL